jgi:hypothetical protein
LISDSQEIAVDVHPPARSIHTWKDFLLHLLTITIGLFIALTLQAAVESLQHRHLVRDARENLRREIEVNHRRYSENAPELRRNRNQLARDLDQLRELRDGKKLENPSLSWAWKWDSYGDAAWETARESGAVVHMDPGWISTYSWVYRQQGYVNSMALAIVNEETQASASVVVAKDPSKLSPAAIETLLIKSAEIDLSFATLETMMKSLDDMYAEALKRP